jgi:hypothetical protein
MDRKAIKWATLLIIPLLIIISLFVNNSLILNNIYYHLVYETDILDSSDIIDKLETFEYHRYLIYHEGVGGGQNISKFNPSFPEFNYINRDCIEYIKSKINEDRQKFYFAFYRHCLLYRFNETERSKVFFSYNYTTIFNATNHNNETIFSVDYNEYYRSYIGSWYINFTQVPNVLNKSYTLLLKNIILIKMLVDYSITRYAGEGHYIRQYIALSSDLQVIFIYIHGSCVY